MNENIVNEECSEEMDHIFRQTSCKMKGKFTNFDRVESRVNILEGD